MPSQDYTDCTLCFVKLTHFKTRMFDAQALSSAKPASQVRRPALFIFLGMSGKSTGETGCWGLLGAAGSPSRILVCLYF
ncbi:hypothetical protein SKAU_G00391530 [Synaphobranchus kaupii]|uniref:Uncharacterized protein n=1 Tax=Synaphobranchus kaupii TaxID=118154 RepID=A0A9Q1EBQ0_SYNKA|nr:hypothetical protein SKAU_G00391530 [Synaphobranchus kaupii]